MSTMPDPRPPLRLASPTTTTTADLADQIAQALELATGDVTVELVYRDQRLARIHVHTHRTLTRSQTQ